MRKLTLTLIALAATFAATLAAAPPDKPAKSALDKKTLEAYIRHLFVWNDQIKVDVSDPKPSPMKDFWEVVVHASAGQAERDVPLYVSKDGQQILQGSVYNVANNPFKPELDKLKTDFQPSFGTPGAPVVIVDFSDFQCPYCAAAAKTIRDNLLKEYPKEVRVYFLDFPIESLHPWARAAANGGRCIFRQNAAAFWDYHDWIYANQKEITEQNLGQKILEFAKGKELDTLQLNRCMQSKAGDGDITKSIALAKSVGVDSTPTLFINGRKVPGSIEWPALKGIIDFELNYQKTAKNAGEDCGCEIKLPTPFGK